ncbi:MAG: papain-like cysteine protease family protein [Francisellaceae bacterium]
MSAGDKSEDYERSEQLLQDKLDHLGYTKEQLKAMLLHGVRPHNQENFYSSLGLKNIAIDFDEDFFRQINRLLNQYGPIIWNRSALGGDGFHSQVISGITHVNSEINVLEINDSMSQGTKSVPLQYYTGETIEELYEQGGMKFWISERKYWFNPFSSFLSYPEYCRDIRGEMPVV